MNDVIQITIRVYGETARRVYYTVLEALFAREAPAWPLPGERAHRDALHFCSGGDLLW